MGSVSVGALQSRRSVSEDGCARVFATPPDRSVGPL